MSDTAINARDIQNLINGDANGDQIGGDKVAGDKIIGDRVHGNKVTIELHNVVHGAAIANSAGPTHRSDDLQRLCQLVSGLINLADLGKLAEPQHRAILHDIRGTLERLQSLHATSALDTSQSIRDIRVSEMLPLVSTPSLADPKDTLASYTAMRNLRRKKGDANVAIIRGSSLLQRWSADPQSASLFVKGSFSTRHLLRDFAADIIGRLTETTVPVVWFLRPRNGEPQPPEEVDVIKHLIFQILQLPTIRDKYFTSWDQMRFRDARTVNDWFSLLDLILANIEHIYFVVDLAALSASGEVQDHIWPVKFTKLFDQLQVRNIPTIVKIIFLCRRRPTTSRPEYETIIDVGSQKAVARLQSESLRHAR
ncbi:hypothetical protein BJX99DRAFT_264518 [Aspergillus californicus]